MNRFLKFAKANYQLYLILLIPVIWLLLFKYHPMYGAQIAFRKFRAADGIWGSEWVGFDNFIRLFSNFTRRKKPASLTK